MSEFYQSLSHSKWDCKYHVVFVPKYRRKVMFGEIRKFLGPIFMIHDWHARRSVELWKAI
jgi:putative transposase